MSILFMLSVIIFSSSSNWFMMWLAMEMNTITFIGILFLSVTKNESTIIYFLVQSLSSFFFLGATLWAETFVSQLLSMMIIFLCLMMKLGLVPFHNWMPPIISYSNKKLLFCFLIIQKIIPFMWVMMTHLYLISVLIFTSTLNMMWLSPLNIPQLSIKMLLGVSSMSQSGWLMISTLNFSLWEFYFLTYSIMLLSILWAGEKNLKMLYQNSSPFLVLIIVLTLGGIPPMMGFYPKLLVMGELMLLKMWMIILCNMAVSLVDLFIYFRLGSLSMFTGKNSLKWAISHAYPFQLIMLNLLLVMGMWL